MQECGVVYVAAKSNKHVQEAHESAQSLKRWCSTLPITVFSDKPNEFDVRLFPDVRYIPSPANKRELGTRVEAVRRMPYHRNLYMDTDTQICGNITHMFGVLDTYDIAMALAPRRVDPAGFAVYGEVLPDWFPEFNGGVILIKRSASSDQLTRRWAKQYALIDKWNDQMAMRVALFHSIRDDQLKLYTLPPEYNCRIIMLQFLGGKCYITHGRDPDVGSPCASINSRTGARMWIPRHGIFRWKDWRYEPDEKADSS